MDFCPAWEGCSPPAPTSYSYEHTTPWSHPCSFTGISAVMFSNWYHLYVFVFIQGRSDGEKMAIKQMGTASDNEENSSKLKDIKETMQQSNSEISELKRKLNELELLAESKLKKKQEMIETAHKQLREEENEKEILYEKVCFEQGRAEVGVWGCHTPSILPKPLVN